MESILRQGELCIEAQSIAKEHAVEFGDENLIMWIVLNKENRDSINNALAILNKFRAPQAFVWDRYTLHRSYGDCEMFVFSRKSSNNEQYIFVHYAAPMNDSSSQVSEFLVTTTAGMNCIGKVFDELGQMRAQEIKSLLMRNSTRSRPVRTPPRVPSGTTAGTAQPRPEQALVQGVQDMNV